MKIPTFVLERKKLPRLLFSFMDNDLLAASCLLFMNASGEIIAAANQAGEILNKCPLFPSDNYFIGATIDQQAVVGQPQLP